MKLNADFVWKDITFFLIAFIKKNIDFFFKPQNKNKNMYPFIFIKDSAIEEMLNAEHCMYGYIDMSKGYSLLLESDADIRAKMNQFQKGIDQIGRKYKEIMFITIGDSVLLKYCFRVVYNNKLDVSNFDFKKMIKCFKEVKEHINNIFQMECYGVFTYGYNKAGNLKSETENVFHSGILSKSFSLLIDFENCVRKIQTRGDMYLTKSLYQAYRFYARKEYKEKNQVTEYSQNETGISEFDNCLKLKGAVAIKLADTPFLIKK